MNGIERRNKYVDYLTNVKGYSESKNSIYNPSSPSRITSPKKII